MAGTAPTCFSPYKTLGAGPVHCSVWLFRTRTAAATLEDFKATRPFLAVSTIQVDTHNCGSGKDGEHRGHGVIFWIGGQLSGER